MEKDIVKIPEDVKSYSKEKKLELAKQLIETTKMSNVTIAEKLGMHGNSVSNVRNHMKGVLTNPPKKGGGKPASEKGSQASDQKLPSSDEKDKANSESQLKDLGSRVESMETKVAKIGEIEVGVKAILERLSSNPSTTGASQQQQTRSDEGMVTTTTQTEFTVFPFKVMVDAYRISLFEQWKSTRNTEARLNGGKLFTKGLEGFFLDAFDEWMERRHADFEYQETRPVRRPQIVQPQPAQGSA